MSDKETVSKTDVPKPEKAEAGSKTQQLAEAAMLRTKVEREAAGASSDKTRVPLTPEDKKIADAKKAAAEENIAIRPQAVAGSLTGRIDPEAMGDVKGDGGDAKDYPDADPDKALGVPTYEYGLRETRVGGPNLEAGKRAVFGQRVSEKTQAEMERGRAALSNAKVVREERAKGRTVVTDADEDPDGDAGKTAAEKAAAEKAKKS